MALHLDRWFNARRREFLKAFLSWAATITTIAVNARQLLEPWAPRTTPEPATLVTKVGSDSVAVQVQPEGHLTIASATGTATGTSVAQGVGASATNTYARASTTNTYVGEGATVTDGLRIRLLPRR